ncbi:site-specific DNA recombinase [Natronincola peptidivorans]|uniref:Site-specific DNA recombinase n=1 Tax=Natronincola peptidivorans TaxID=426128 RepID=A0A1I0F131_9FIRM|nr:recombinase family protein [Natronincola peptidivorans]SET51690.1 site-specific DNA recombinase [Natronincola peptidivorans]
MVSITENLDGSPESVIMESVFEGMAEYYSKNLAREVMKGMKETAYQCKHTGGIPPLGYKVMPDKKYAIDEKEAIIVRTIFDMYINGYSYGKIIDHLNLKGYKTKTGKTFGKNSIYGILDNEKYSGVYIFNRSSKKDAFGKRNSHLYKDESEIIRVEGGIPAIVSTEVFRKTKEIMNSRKRAPGANKAKETYLLTGLIICGQCGTNMQGNRRNAKNKPKYVSYRCGCRLQKRTCDNKEIRKEYIEEFVLSELEKNILNDKAIPILVEKINNHLKEQAERGEVSIKALKNEVEEVKTQIDNIVTAIAQGFYQEEFKGRMDELQGRKLKLEQNILEMENKSNASTIKEEQVKKLFSMFRDFVKERNLPECKKFVQNYVDKVIVYKDHVEVIFNVVFEFLDKDEAIKIYSTVEKKQLFKMYKNIA